MNRTYAKHVFAASLALSIAACSSNDDDDSLDNEAADESTSETSELNEEAPDAVNTGEPGGDISAIAGLWDGSETTDETTDIVYYNLAAEGVLTRFDYQQDGVADASGENCYLVGDPITVTPEADDDYSLFNAGINAVRTDDTLDITFLSADVNDFDADGDTTEMPVVSWTLLTTPGLEDLNSCTTDAEGDNVVQEDAEGLPMEETADRPEISRAQCVDEGGIIVGDIGDGAISRPDYTCPSGLLPTANVIALEGEPIAVEGEVCCPS